MSFPIPLRRPLVVFDLETTGISPRKDRIIELAAVKVMPDGTEVTKTWLLNPTIPIPRETTAIHGISDDIVKDCPTFADCAQEIYNFFGDGDLSGFNSDHFDVPCLEEEFNRCGINFNAYQRRRVDVYRIYQRKEPRNLSAAVMKYCGHEHKNAHGAESDAKATLEVLKAQLQLYDDLPRDIDVLDEWIAPHDPLNADKNGMFRWNVEAKEWQINFGKKKGKSLRTIMLEEPKFLKWMVNGDFEADARMIAADALEGRLPSAPILATPTKE